MHKKEIIRVPTAFIVPRRYPNQGIVHCRQKIMIDE